MKAVIVECSNSAAVALCDDGTFRKVKNKNYSIGQELILKKTYSANRTAKKLSICASLALFLLSFIGVESYSYMRPYSYVSLDINPSIEYALNRFDKVIKVFGINDGGQQIVSSIESDIKNRNITTALGVTLKQLEKDHYISQEEDNHVIISVYSNNDTKAKAIASRVDTFSNEETTICSIDTVTVSQETKDSADSLGITPGKLALIKAVEETSSDTNFDVSQWTDKTVSELETTIQQANNQSSDGTAPASDTVIDSEYLSSVLDDTTTDDGTATASATDVDTEDSSASTDKQPTTNNTTTGSSASSSDHAASLNTGDSSTNSSSPAVTDNNSSSKPDENAGTSKPVPADADNSTSSNEPADSNSTSKDPAGTTGNTDSSQKPEDGESTSKEPSADNSGSSDTLTEESSSKKDSYPAGETVADEDTSVAEPEDPTVSDETETSEEIKTPQEAITPDDTSSAYESVE